MLLVESRFAYQQLMFIAIFSFYNSTWAHFNVGFLNVHFYRFAYVYNTQYYSVRLVLFDTKTLSKKNKNFNFKE